MASFPTSVFAKANITAGQTSDPSDVNDLSAEIIAIESGYLNGTARLNSSAASVATLNVTAGSTMATLNVTGGSTFGGAINLTGSATLSSLRTVTGSTFTGMLTLSSVASTMADLTIVKAAPASSGAINGAIQFLGPGIQHGAILYRPGATPASRIDFGFGPGTDLTALTRGYFAVVDARGANIWSTTTAGLPAESANEQGLIALDVTANTLVYYVGAKRYKLTGSTF